MVDDRWDYLDEDYADEKPFVKIRTHPKTEESFIEKPSKIKKKGRKAAQRMKEYHFPREEPDNGR